MRVFDVLDANLDIHKSYLLEASAGTGKTFSIENIVLRLLIEASPVTGAPIPLEKILVVTFTRAATRDLKVRIRHCIDRARGFFQALLDGMHPCPFAGYLEPFLEADEQAVRAAKQTLEYALFCFDRAQIYTIHGFCSRMLRDHLLEGDLQLLTGSEESNCSTRVLIAAIKDYFRTKVSPNRYSPAQLKKVKSLFSINNQKTFEESLAEKLLRTLKQGIEIKENVSLPTLQKMFQEAVAKHANLTPESIVQDFCSLAPTYTGVCNKKGGINPKSLRSVERFAALFDLDTWDEEALDCLVEEGIPIFAILKNPRTKQPKEPPKLNHPHLLKILKEDFKPIVDQISSPDLIFARMAHDCREHLLHFMEKEELYTFDDLLKNMQKALSRNEMKLLIQEKYQAAIIDEFQDTDPIQWDIFQQLFLTDEKLLYLVGDPKQSIYAFRQADIYTYLQAKEALGEEHYASLNTNYRSSPQLVKALNTLFDQTNAPNLITLPRIQKSLPYQPVNQSDKTESLCFDDGLGAVHFCLATHEKEYKPDEASLDFFFPYFVKEIRKLHEQYQIPYRDIAILVADRYQGENVARYLRQCQIPCITQRSTHLANTLAPEALREVVKAVISPGNDSAVKVALGGQIVGWTHEQLSLLEDPCIREDVLARLHHLRTQLFEDGIGRFFQTLMRSQWDSSPETIAEKILRRKGGSEFLSDLTQTAEILLDYQTEKKASPDALLMYLDEINTVDIEENSKLMRQLDPGQDAVNIITGHSSKGLEYAIVIALGLIRRSRQPEKLFPYHCDGKDYLIAVSDEEDTRYQRYCDELDAEKMRQLYVTMTRAKYRLYLPVLQGEIGKEPAIGTASPMELYLARLTSADQAASLIERFESIAKEEITYEILAGNQKPQPSSIEKETVSLIPPKNMTIPGKPVFVQSFSGMTQQGSRAREEVQEDPPHDYHIENKTIHTLPAGSETGNLLHLIFETIDFNSLEENSLASLISNFTVNTNFEGWETVIAEMVWRTLTAPLDNGAALKDVQAMYREMEFLYPWEGGEGFLKGVIDLIFMHEGKYYLLDWKSNWLGSSNEAYSKKQVENAMQQHQYFLQANIYREALRRYLNLIENRSFEEIYGGTYYVFLRGIDNHGIIRFE